MYAVPVNWDDAPRREVEVGPIAGTWRDLGTAAGPGKSGCGASQVRPGMRSTPAHTHSGEEEVFFVLAGSGLSWQGGGPSRSPPATASSTSSRGRPTPSSPARTASTCSRSASGRLRGLLPAQGQGRVAGHSWVKAGDTPHPFAQEAAAGESRCRSCPRRGRRASSTSRTAAEKAVARGEAPRRAGPQHGGRRGAHGAAPLRSAGRQARRAPALPQRRRGALRGARGRRRVPRAGARRDRWQPEEHPVRAGDVVAVLAGTGAAHAFRAGAAGLSYLAYGNRDPRDTIWYPRSTRSRSRAPGGRPHRAARLLGRRGVAPAARPRPPPRPLRLGARGALSVGEAWPQAPQPPSHRPRRGHRPGRPLPSAIRRTPQCASELSLHRRVPHVPRRPVAGRARRARASLPGTSRS